MKQTSSILASLFALLAPLVTDQGAAKAQQFDAQQFRFSPHALDLFQIEAARVSAGFQPNAFVGFNYASKLVELDVGGVPSERLEQLMTLNVLLSASLDEWVSIGLDVPLHLVHSGVLVATNPAASGGFSLGDIRLGMKVAFLRPHRLGLGVGASFAVDMPTGSDDKLSAETSVVGTGKLLLDSYWEHLRLMLNLGYKLRAAEVSLPNGQSLDDELVTGVGFGVPLWRDQIELIHETTFATQIAHVFEESTSRIEMHGGLRFRDEGTGIAVGAGAGGGLLAGVSNPEYRVFGEFGYRPQKYSVLDTDGDGLLDDVDQCVNDPEDLDGFQDSDGCPELDNDGDGIPDTADKCPMVPEDADSFQDTDGCPEPDNDGDGILDTSDKCPNDPEDKDGDQDTDGCPDIDTDGDGIADYADQCPKDPEDKDGFKDEDGCPEPDNDGDGILDKSDKCPLDPEDMDNCQDEDGCPEPGRVCVTKDKLVITDKIFFEYNKSIIKSESFPLLDEIAKVIKDNPDIQLIEIQGHTDADGNDKYNLKLSDKRAKSVRTHLIKLGVPHKRMAGKGYGETKPIAPNDTDEGKEKNRRVEFIIVKRAQ